MSSQNNMAKESYPYKIIQSGYAPSSPHKVFKSCTTPMTSQAIVSYFWCSQTFSIFTQYMSMSHGHSTLGGIEWLLWRRQKRGERRNKKMREKERRSNVTILFHTCASKQHHDLHDRESPMLSLSYTSGNLSLQNLASIFQ